MNDRNVNAKVTYVHYIYIYLIHFFNFDNNLHTVQDSDAR